MYSGENGDSTPETGAAPDAEGKTSNENATPAETAENGTLLESLATVSTIAQGKIVRGHVLKLTDTEVVIDIGLKSETVIPRAELAAEDGSVMVAAGDAIDVWVERYDEQEGTVSVSYTKAARWKVWDEIESAFEAQTTLRGRVIKRIKGGLTVDIGVPAFLPGSQADVRPHSNLDALQGQEIACKILKLNKKRNNVVVSRKLALEEELNRLKASLQEKLQSGVELAGRVKNLTDYGAFVDLGGMDGLLHITDLSWGRVSHPSEVVQVGQEVRVKVLKYDAEKGRVSLGLKQLSPDPWEGVPPSYPVGRRAVGRVVGVVDYGAFVELEPGVEGLIHVSEMTWSKRTLHPSKMAKPGDRVEVVVLDVNPAQRRIALSLKQTLPDPWTTLTERHSEGSAVQGRVRNLTDFGVFVEIEPGVDGLIHLSNLSWGKNVKHPSEVLRKGQRVEAVVLNIDSVNRRLSLGLKQLQPDVWDDFFSKAKVGDVVGGEVSCLASFGAFVALGGGVEALCHNSEMEDAAAAGGTHRVEVGGELKFRVLRLNPAKRKIGLSLKDVDQSSPRPETETRTVSPTTETVSSSAAGGAESLSPLPAAKAES